MIRLNGRLGSDAHDIVILMAVLVMLVPLSSRAQEFAPSPDQRVVLVTGSTGGLGREVALALADRGNHVIVHGRNVERGESLVAEIAELGVGSARFYPADFGNLDEIRAFGAAVLGDYSRLDVLVNNAGIFFPKSTSRRVSDDGYELHFQVNYLATYMLTDMLMPLLEASAPSRIINVASAGQRALDFDNLMLESDYDGSRAYSQSKLAQIMMTFSLANELSDRGIAINALHPSTFMNTDMVLEAGYEPRSSVATGRDAILQLIDNDVGTGKYFDVFEEAQARPQAYDAEALAKLMAMSADLTSRKD